MPDLTIHDPDFDTLPVPLGLALAQLPLEAPDRSAWPGLQQRIAARHRAPRWPLALVASLVLALLMLPGGVGAPSSPARVAATGNAATHTAQLASLMSESQRLERLIAAAEDGTSSASAAALNLELEDRLHAIDGALEAERGDARQLDLWQQRVQLLRDVAAVETSRRYLASEGRGFDVALVAAY